jgi:hypothetical protein
LEAGGRAYPGAWTTAARVRAQRGRGGFPPPAAVTAWSRTLPAATPRWRGLNSAAIPDEQGRILPDGRLQIFITLPDNRGAVTLNLPPDQWGWRPGRA